MLTDLLDYLVWLPIGVAAMFALFPLVVLATQRMSARPAMDPLDLAAVPRATADYLMGTTRELIALGFADPVTLALPDAVSGVKGYLIMLADRAAGDMAMATVLVSDSGPTAIKAPYVEFYTRFTDGVRVTTSNADQLQAFPPSPGLVRTQAWQAADAAELLRLHRHLVAAHGSAGRREVYPADDPAGWLAVVAFEQVFADLADRGWLRRTADGTAFVPTVKGAYLMTWGLMPPVSWVRRWLLGRRAARLLAAVRREPDGG